MKAVLKEAAGKSKGSQEKAEENVWREKERAATKALQEAEKAEKGQGRLRTRQRKRYRYIEAEKVGAKGTEVEEAGGAGRRKG
jgi:hypothetical protein